VGCFGSKAGMTQMFTDDGLCVPVTVIGIREGNFVTMVRAMRCDSDGDF
jgi:large subunit ribosomal protein L3